VAVKSLRAGAEAGQQLKPLADASDWAAELLAG
jgi:hypothetical protein